MTKMTKAGRALAIAIAGAFVLPVLPALTGTMADAQADGIRIRVGGSVRVRVGGPHVRVRQRYRRHHYRPSRVHVYGGYYTYQFASPPPPPVYECDTVPVYTTRTSTEPIVATTYVQRDPLPRFGLGITAGRFEADEGRDADEFGVFARLRLTDALEVELESSKTEHDAGDRIDKKFGGALYLDLAPHSDWAPYAVGGLGVQESEGSDGAWTSERSYGEIGGGLRWRVNRSFTLAGDVRVGQSSAIEEEEDYVALTVLPAIADDENYTRLTLKGILYF